MASALAASKLQIPIAHIEAGERSFNRSMPEEINRLVTDTLTDIHFCTSKKAIEHLASEGMTDSVHWVGDVMLDAMFFYRPIAHRRSKILTKLELTPKDYCLVTIHRANNTDDLQRLEDLVNILNGTAETIVFPVHPRTAKALADVETPLEDHVKLIGPIGYLDMIQLEDHARLIATDSGGVQREAYFLGIPCLSLRDETEWTETVDVGWNLLVGTDRELALDAWNSFTPPEDHPPIFGEGIASQRIANILGSFDLLHRHNKFDRPVESNREHTVKVGDL
jgi:UDP-N-acetylglucosamine 2-epimerase